MPLFGLSVDNVSKMEAKRDFEGLIKALNYKKDKIIRQRAAEVLGKFFEPKAVTALAIASKDSDFFVRNAAVNSLGNISSNNRASVLIRANAEEALEGALNDSNDSIRFSSILWLSYLSNLSNKKFIQSLRSALKNSYIEPLIQKLKDEDSRIATGAMKALVIIGEPSVEFLIDKYKGCQNDEVSCSILDKILISISEPAVAPLIKALKNSNFEIRYHSAGVLRNLGFTAGSNGIPVEVLNYFLSILNAPAEWRVSSDDKIKAARFLGALRDERVVEPLFRMLMEADTCKIALNGLAIFGDLSVAERIIDFLIDMFGTNSSKRALDKGKLASYDRKTLVEELKNLFGDYAELLVTISIGFCTKEKFPVGVSDSLGGSDSYRIYWDTRESDEAVLRLCKINTAISTNILHKISLRKDISAYCGWSQNYYGDTTESIGTLCFSPQREAANKELIKRGKPSYEPLAYLQKELWKIV